MASVRVDWIKIDGVISKIRFELFDVFSSLANEMTGFGNYAD